MEPALQSSLELGPVEMQQDLFERLVLPGILWQPLVVIMICLSNTTITAADHALQYAKDLGAFPLSFFIAAVVLISVLFFGLLNEVMSESLYHWQRLHLGGWKRAHRGGRLPEILPYTAIDLASDCTAQWHDKTFYQRVVAYLKQAVGAREKECHKEPRAYAGLSADVVYQILLSNVGTKIPEASWALIASWRKLENRLIWLSTAIPAVGWSLVLLILRMIWKWEPENPWNTALANVIWPLISSIIVVSVGIISSLLIREYYHAQAIIAWVHGSNAMVRLFYVVWPQISTIESRVIGYIDRCSHGIS